VLICRALSAWWGPSETARRTKTLDLSDATGQSCLPPSVAKGPPFRGRAVTPVATARRFARALLDVAEKQNASAQLDAELSEFARALEQSEELRRALAHPGLPNEKKAAIVDGVCRTGSDLLRGFLKILVDHQAADLAPLVTAAFHEALNLRRGIASAEAYSAVPLGEGEKKALEAGLKKTAGREVELVTHLDPALLGGVLVRMGGRTYDGSVRSHLLGLRNALAGIGGS